jgi:integrase
VDFTPGFLLELRDAWAARGYRAANYRRQILKNVQERSLIEGTLEIDPFSRVGGVRRPSQMKEPHPLWPAPVVESVIRGLIAKKRYGLARAVVIGRYTGARRGDLVKLTKAARGNGRFSFLSGKRFVPVDLPEDPALTAWLAEIPDMQPDEPRQGRKVDAASADSVIRLKTAPPTLVFNLENKRYTEDGLGLELKKAIVALQAAGKLPAANFDLHGLRHTRGVEIALSGASDAQGAAMMGHWSPTSFAQYRRQADRVRMSDDAGALVLAFRDQGVNTHVSNQVSNKCLTEPTDGPDVKKAQVRT